MDIAKAIAILAGALNASAYILYNVQIYRSRTSIPNTAAWAVWSSIVILNVSSYWKMSNDWETSILPLVATFGCIATFVLALMTGRFKKLDVYDSIALVIGIVAAFAWWYFHSASYANLIVQAAIAIGFIPIYRSLWRDPRVERWPAWALWTSAFFLGFIVVCLRDKPWQEYVYFVSCFCLHLAVIPLCLRSLPRRSA